MLSDSDRWRKIKELIMVSWDYVTDEQLERTKGNISSISNLVQKSHKVSKQEIAKKLVDIMHVYNNDEDRGGKDDYKEHPVY